MSIEKELQDELVEAVEGTDEEIMEMKADKEVDGDAAVAEVAAAAKKSAPGKTTEKPKGPKDAMAKLKEEADEDEEDEDDDEEEMEEETFKEDLDALVSSEATLSEGFRTKAGVIFEAALKSKLSEEVARLEESYEEKLQEEVMGVRADLVEKVDGYLNYVVENWMEENALAVEAGIRTEIAESFMSALKQTFEEHYVEVPEAKVDLVDELAEKVEALEEKYNAAIDKNIELAEAVDTLTREKVIVEAAEGLSVAQAEKLKTLVEDVAFEDAETFAGKVETIKESYFKKAVASEVVEEELNESVQVQSVSPQMQRYLDALKSHK